MRKEVPLGEQVFDYSGFIGGAYGRAAIFSRYFPA
jgi:hypothetical protein